jgi:hypothetical protein
VLQLAEREDAPDLVVRRGNDIEVLSLSRAGAATRVAGGAKLASGLRALVELPDDRRPRSERVEPLLPSGNLLIPLETRDQDGTVADTIGLFTVSGSGFVAAVQTSVPTFARKDPVDLPFGAALVAIPASAGTSLADLSYLSFAESSPEKVLDLCGPTGCFPIAKPVAVPRAPSSELLAYVTGGGDASTLTVLGVGVTSPQGERARGIVIDAPAPASDALRFTTYALEGALLCGDDDTRPSTDDAIECAKACARDPVTAACNCFNPFAPLCVTCDVCAASEVRPDRVYATAANLSGLGFGASVGFAGLFQVSSGGETASFLGLFSAYHDGPGACEDPTTNCPPNPTTLDAAFLLTPDLVNFLEGSGSIGVAQDLTGDGLDDSIVGYDPVTERLLLSVSAPPVVVEVPIQQLFGIEDVNGDGLFDLVGARGAALVVVLGSATLPFVEVDFVLDAPPREVKFADLDFDGVQDLIVRTAGEPPSAGSCSPGTVYVAFGDASLSDPIPVGSGACIEEMLPLRLAQSADGISDVAFLRRVDDGVTAKWSLGALFGSTSRFLTSPVPLGPLSGPSELQALVAFSAGFGDEQSNVEGAVLLLRGDGAETSTVARALLLGDQLEVTDVVDPPASGAVLEVSSDSLVAPSSNGEVVVWDGGRAVVVGPSDPVRLIDVPELEPTEGPRALLGGRGGVEFVLFAGREVDGQPFVDFAIVTGGTLSRVTTQVCYDGVGALAPLWLSDTELSVCGTVLNVDNVPLACDYAAGAVPVGTKEAEPDVSFAPAGRSFTHDLDGDGLLDRIESTTGEILRQWECSSQSFNF